MPVTPALRELMVSSAHMFTYTHTDTNLKSKLNKNTSKHQQSIWFIGISYNSGRQEWGYRLFEFKASPYYKDPVIRQ